MCHRYFDIYRDPLVSEARKVAPLLQSLVVRVRQVAEEWPDYPVLMQVSVFDAMGMRLHHAMGMCLHHAMGMRLTML